MALRWQLDMQSFPVARLRVVGEDDGQLPDWDSLVQAAEALLARDQPCVLVHDMRHARPDAARRRLIKTWIAPVPPTRRRLIRAYALVAHTALQRGIVTAVLWFIPHPLMPIQVFADEASAIAWLRGFLPPTTG